jgi:lambda family phage portal protein
MVTTLRQRLGAGIAKFASYVSGYDAVSQQNRRKVPAPIVKREDDNLRPQQRKQLQASTQNVHRNFAVARWMIARHLDYVSTFGFQSRCGDKQLDNCLESLVTDWSKPWNFEITGRFSRQKFIRLAEMQRTLNGDMGILKLRRRKLQAIESDLIRNPTNGGFPVGIDPADFLHGVQCNRYGKPIAYSICRRGKSNDITPGSFRYEFERVVPARSMVHFSHFDRFDQLRGISPLACAVNSLVDVYEGIDWALAKLKVAQLFALAFYRDRYDDDDLGGTQVGEGDEPRYSKLNFGNGPQQLDLDAGDRAEFLESKSPSTEFQAFCQVVIALALKALDIPYSFYSEDFTTYSGARQAMLQYEQAAKIKRQDIVDLLDLLLTWRAVDWINLACLPEGVRLEHLKWRWVPNGQPWIDPLKEIQAKSIALTLGLTSRQREALESGGDFFDIADELAAESEYLKSKGLPTDINPGNVTINEVSGK